MRPDPGSVASAYDQHYAKPNHFRHKSWLYRPYIRALMKKAGLHAADSLLVAGGGQGFFTALFAELGFDALGVDISHRGILSARQLYGKSGAGLEVDNLLRLPERAAFDFTFVRSYSLHNSSEFARVTEVTDARPGGVLIFDYYTRLGRQEGTPSSWLYHSFDDLVCHFNRYPDVQCYFSSRFDALLLVVGVQRADDDPERCNESIHWH